MRGVIVSLQYFYHFLVKKKLKPHICKYTSTNHNTSYSDKMSLTVQVITVVYVLIMMYTIYHLLCFLFMIMMMQLFTVYHLLLFEDNEINIYKNVLCTAVYIK